MIHISLRPTRRLAAAAAAALCCTTLAIANAPASQAATPSQMSYVVLPHPDDEFQDWSLVENSPDNYKVFILLTHGEQTTYCTPSSGGYQSGLEKAPNPALPSTGEGRWTSSCDQARLNSFRAYFSQMSSQDTSIPGSFNALGTKGPFAANGAALCRRDYGTGTPDTTDKNCVSGRSGDKVDASAQVWTDNQNRGALVVFNLGDGDLKTEEVTWAVRTVLNNRAALGINASLPNYNILGAYANDQNDGGYSYPNADHKAIHSSLYNTDFGVKYQAAATSKNDPDVMRRATVSTAATNAAFSYSGSVATGAHNNNYGWLWPAPDNQYLVDRSGQNQLFHTNQYFWMRYVR